MRTTDQIICVVKQGEPAVLLARLRGLDGNLLTPTNVSSLKYSIYDMTTTTNPVVTATLTPLATYLFATLQLDPRWDVDATGYNFRATLPQTAFPAYTSNQHYRVEVIWFGTDGNPGSAEWDGRVRRILSAPLS